MAAATGHERRTGDTGCAIGAGLGPGAGSTFEESDRRQSEPPGGRTRHQLRLVEAASATPRTGGGRPGDGRDVDAGPQTGGQDPSGQQMPEMIGDGTTVPELEAVHHLSRPAGEGYGDDHAVGPDLDRRSDAGR